MINAQIWMGYPNIQICALSIRYSTFADAVVMAPVDLYIGGEAC